MRRNISIYNAIIFKRLHNNKNTSRELWLINYRNASVNFRVETNSILIPAIKKLTANVNPDLKKNLCHWDACCLQINLTALNVSSMLFVLFIHNFWQIHHRQVPACLVISWRKVYTCTCVIVTMTLPNIIYFWDYYTTQLYNHFLCA